MPRHSSSTGHFVYIVQCRDQSLYTGSTNNLAKRIHEHNTSKQGAHYTKIRRPVFLVYVEKHTSHGAARSREAVLKRLDRKKKLALIHARVTQQKKSNATFGENVHDLVSA